MITTPWVLWAERLASEQLLGTLIASSLLCTLGLIAARFAKHRSAAYRSWIWQTVGATIVAAGILLCCTTGIPLQHQSRATPQIAVEPIRPVRNNTPAVTPSLANGPLPSQAAPIVPFVAEPMSLAQPTKSLPWLQVSSSELLAGATTCWLVVGCVHLLLLLLSIFQAFLVAVCPSSVTPQAAHDALGEAGRRIGFESTWPLRLSISTRVASPMSVGVLAPSIVLPGNCVEWSQAKLETVLAHELAHVQRRDNLWHWVMRLACCLAWFNPLVWLAARRAIAERERACDDRVLQAGVPRHDYARTLVEVAAAMSGHTRPLSAMIAMAEPPIQSRLQAILADSVCRSPIKVPTKLGIAVLFLGCALLLGTIRPLAAQKPATAKTDNSSQAELSSEPQSQTSTTQETSNDLAAKDESDGLIQLPKSVIGSVTDLDGAPIAGASVVIELARFLPSNVNGQIRKRPIQQWTVETDAEGKYAFDPSGVGKVNGKCSFWPLRARAEGFAQEHGRSSPTVAEVAKGKPIGAVKLRFARPITGRIVANDGAPTGAIIRGVGIDHDPNNSWWLQGIEIDESGLFRIFVPLEMEVELMFYVADHAPKRVPLESRQTDLGTIKMELGTTVEGELLDQSGQPVAGSVVTLDAKRSFGSSAISGPHFAVLTDASGNFRFPPCLGECRLAAASYSERTDVVGFGYIDGVAPPAVVPQMLTLDEPGGKKRVILRGAKTKSIRGTIRWENGEPAEGLDVAAGAMLIGGSTKLDETKTGTDGQYRLELPAPLSAVYITAIGAKDKEGRWHMAHGVADSPARSSIQSISLDRFEDDLEAMDWELRLHKRTQPESAAESRARRGFDKLARKEEAYRQEFATAFENAKTPADQQRVGKELDPRNLMPREYLAFERKHRGSPYAFQALARIVMDSSSMFDTESTVAKSKAIAIDRLIQHYMQHEDLPQTFGGLGRGLTLEHAENYLRKAILKSPHPEVQAAAILRSVDLRREAIRSKDMLAGAGQAWIGESLQREMEEYVQRLRNLDVEKARDRIKTDLDKLATEYSDVAHDQAGTYGKLTEYYKTAMSSQLGSPAPPLVAKDLAGRPFDLASLRGKTVVVTFCYVQDQSKYTNDLQPQQPIWEPLPNQDIAPTLTDKDVEFVTVVWAYELESFKETFDRGGLVGTIIPQGKTDAEARMSWGVVHHPTTYVIDAEGKLVGRQFGPLRRTFLGTVDGKPIPAQTTKLLEQLKQLLE